MSTFFMIFSFISAVYIAYCVGLEKGSRDSKKKIDQRSNNAVQFYRNLTKKQAAQIEKIQDRLVYLSIGELEAFLNFMMDDGDNGFGADENYPILAIVNPLKEEADLNLEDK